MKLARVPRAHPLTYEVCEKAGPSSDFDMTTSRQPTWVSSRQEHLHGLRYRLHETDDKQTSYGTLTISRSAHLERLKTLFNDNQSLFKEFL